MLKTLITATRDVRYRFDALTYRAGGRHRLLAGLRDFCKNQPLLIVGNGPSLNNTPLEKFDSVKSIGMNKIDLIYSRTSWRPDLVVCTNNLVARQNQDAWVAAGVPVYLSWKCRYFIRRELRRNFSYFLSRTSNEFSTNIIDGVGSAGTVTYTALQFAYFMGADPVIIVGVDHSFAGLHHGRENEIEKRTGMDQDHFDPNYFAHGQMWGIPNLPLSERGYTFARQAFEADGRRVLDATIGGKLTIFEKVSIDDAIRLARHE
ncbi:6-hydroxymethylpterin diphosphokinase MptE-like protein [Mycolicibacterium elephantis]